MNAPLPALHRAIERRQALRLRFHRPPAVAWAAALVCALAAWVTGGALAVVRDTTASRVGLLPAWHVPVVVGAGIVAAAVLLSIERRAWRALFVPALLLLPWLPFRVPAVFLLWAGPIKWWVWVSTGAAFLLAHGAARGARRAQGTQGAQGARGADEDASAPPSAAFVRARVAAACMAAFVLYLAGAWLISPQLPGGDEPHYLVITQSLLEDGDLRIENNHRQGDYHAYFPNDINPDYLRRGKDGQIYSIHAPGLPVLVAPAFAVGGYPAVVVFLSLVAALGTALLWRLAFMVTGSTGAAWFGWAAAALSAPFFFHSFQVFPDALGGILALVGVGALVRLSADDNPVIGERSIETGSPRPWLWGAALAVLPWLHTRYAVMAGVLGVAIGLRLLQRRQWRSLVMFAALPLAGAAAWFGFFHAIYGQFSPTAPYGHYTQSSVANIPRGLSGLLFDQQFGILPYAPVYALAFAGFVSLARRFPRLAVEMIILVVAYLTAVAMYTMWWGGHSAAARFAVPALLALGVPAAAWWTSSRRSRAAGVAALVFSLLVTASLTLARHGAIVFNDRDGFAAWLDWLSPVLSLSNALPTLFRGSRLVFAWQIVAWLVPTLFAAWFARRRGDAGAVAGRDAAAGRDAGATVTWMCAAVLMCGLAAGWAVARQRQEPGAAAVLRASASQLDLLRHFAPSARPLSVAFDDGSRGAAAELLGRLRIASPSDRPAAPGVLLSLLDVPAGTYRVAVGSPAAARGRLRVAFGRNSAAPLSWSFGPDASPPHFVLRVPVAVERLTILGDEVTAASPSLGLQPTAVLASSSLICREPAAAGGAYGDLLVFTFDGTVNLEGEGFWVIGGERARLAVSPQDGRATCRLVARNGPVENVVHLEAGRWKATLRMAPHGEQVVEVPIESARNGALLSVRSDKGFRPSEVERANTDNRYLGVWMEAAR